MIFADETTKENVKLLKKSIKNKDLKNVLIAASALDISYAQELSIFELFSEHTIFDTLNELAKNNKVISDKILALSTIYYNPSYYWEIGVGTNKDTVLEKYPYIARLYEEKIEDAQYCRRLFLEWKNLFFKMIKDEVVYKDEKNNAQVYRWAHTFEEFVIEYPAHNMPKVLFSQANKEELFDIILNCKNYPKVPHSKRDIDKRYNEQNSRFYDVQYFATWLSENVLPLLNNKKAEKVSKKISLVSQGLIEEINLIYTDLIKEKDLLKPEDLLIIEKLYQQRLPEVIHEYENFDHKNHATLTHKNKNAEEFLNLFLSEMHTMFEIFNEQLNEKKIENLSFHVRLTKEFIKHNF